MKRIIAQPEQGTIQIAQLTGREIVAYLSSKTNTPKILAKLSGGRRTGEPERWGFISIAYPTGEVVFPGDTFWEAVTKIIKGGRTLYAFDTYSEFRTWATKQPITNTWH